MLQLPSEKVLMKGVETIKAKIVELKNEPSSEEKKKAVQDALAMLETEQKVLAEVLQNHTKFFLENSKIENKLKLMVERIKDTLATFG